MKTNKVDAMTVRVKVYRFLTESFPEYQFCVGTCETDDNSCDVRIQARLRESNSSSEKRSSEPISQKTDDDLLLEYRASGRVKVFNNRGLEVVHT
jgi:hypothetical protein